MQGWIMQYALINISEPKLTLQSNLIFLIFRNILFSSLKVLKLVCPLKKQLGLRHILCVPFVHFIRMYLNVHREVPTPINIQSAMCKKKSHSKYIVYYLGSRERPEFLRKTLTHVFPYFKVETFSNRF